MKTENEYVSIKLSALNKMIAHAGRALDSDSADEEHEALFDLYEQLVQWSEVKHVAWMEEST